MTVRKINSTKVLVLLLSACVIGASIYLLTSPTSATDHTATPSNSSALIELLTINLPKTARSGEPLVISGLVRDPANPKAPFGLPGANITLTITGPDGQVEYLSTLASMAGSWQISYTPKTVGVYSVQVKADGIPQVAHGEFYAS